MGYKEDLKLLKSNEKEVYCIHYACEFLNDENEGISPRITCISIVSLKNDKNYEFSIGSYAEKLNINKEDIQENLNEIEKVMLDDYFSFLEERKTSYWLHWNMNTKNYGFEAIEHRYEVLNKSKEPFRLESENKVSLSNILTQKYGKDYTEEPYMYNLMKITSRHRDVLGGRDEVDAFHKKKFRTLYKSTIAKVWWIRNIYYEIKNNELDKKLDFKNSKLEKIVHHPYMTVFIIVLTVVGLIIGYLGLK